MKDNMSLDENVVRFKEFLEETIKGSESVNSKLFLLKDDGFFYFCDIDENGISKKHLSNSINKMSDKNKMLYESIKKDVDICFEESIIFKSYSIDFIVGYFYNGYNKFYRLFLKVK